MKPDRVKGWAGEWPGFPDRLRPRDQTLCQAKRSAKHRYRKSGLPEKITKAVSVAPKLTPMAALSGGMEQRIVNGDDHGRSVSGTGVANLVDGGAMRMSNDLRTSLKQYGQGWQTRS